MAATKSGNDSIFSLTARAREVASDAISQEGAVFASDPAREDGRTTRPYQEAATKEEMPKAPKRTLSKGQSVLFWQDQADLLFELRYRSHNAWTVNKLVRNAVDEYIIHHADELGLTPSEIEAFARQCGDNKELTS